MLKRGAVTVYYDPLEVRWKGKLIPLSPTEAHLFACVFRRGRASSGTLDGWLTEVGAKATTRSLVLLHIRYKFERLGAENPFERIGRSGIRLKIEPDEQASTSTVIGLQNDLQA